MNKRGYPWYSILIQMLTVSLASGIMFQAVSDHSMLDVIAGLIALVLFYLERQDEKR